MPHLPAAALLIIMERPHPDKQQVLALAAATAAQLHANTICRHWQDCLSLILTRHIAAVVCALDPGPAVRTAIETAGGHLVVAREQRTSIHRSVANLVMRLARRGMKPREIAEDLDLSTQDVMRSLERIRKPQID